MRRAAFRSADVERAIKAAEKCGVHIGRIRIEPNGAIEIVASDPEKADKTDWLAGSPLYRNVA